MTEAKLALLTNFIPPYRVPLFQRLAREVSALRIFVSTAMEPNRPWRADWADLDVERMTGTTLTRSSRHPHGFSEPIFLHLPYTALFQLRRYRPDVVISGQLGLASALAAIHCRLRKDVALVLWLTLSEVSELGRGRARRLLRRLLLRRADAVIVNGESGARYARRLGAADEKIFRAHQAVDVAAFASAGARAAPQRLLFVGSSEPRKGLRPFLALLGRWAASHPERRVELWLLGPGLERADSAPPGLPANLALRWFGPVSYERMPEFYGAGGILAFPTLADEWGLVVNEAMAAGLPILGSVYSQAVEELVCDGRTGWTFHPDRPDEGTAAIDRALACSADELEKMRGACRERIAAVTFEAAAGRILAAVDYARNRRRVTGPNSPRTRRSKWQRG